MVDEGYSMKVFDITCMENIKKTTRYPFDMEATLLNSTIWMTSLSIPEIHDAMYLLKKRSSMWNRFFMNMTYESHILARKVAEIEEGVLNNARKYIFDRTIFSSQYQQYYFTYQEGMMRGWDGYER